jgi:putative ABC transport system permease protein
MLRHAVRSLVRSPIYTLSAVLTLGLGIGANAIVYAFASAVFVRPLPFEREHEIAAIVMTHRTPNGALADNGTGEFDYLRFTARNRTLQHLGTMLPNVYAVVRGDEPETVAGAGVSATLWDVLRTRPVAGRTYTVTEDQPGATNIVIGEALQRRWFPGPPAAALGKSVVVDGVARTIIGVMPLGFSPLMSPGELWTPLGLSDATQTDSTGTRIHLMAGRMRPGVTVQQVSDDVARIARDLAVELPKTHRGWGARALPVRENIGGSTRTLTALLFAFVLVLFALACTNVANLSLARMAQRRAEISTRLALGAAPGSLVARQLAEGALLGLGGGIVGVALTAGALRPLLALVPDLPPLLASVHIDWRVCLFVALLSIVTGAAIALAPGYFGVRSASAAALAGGGRRQQAGIRERRARRWLMSAQVMAAALLLVTSVGIVGTLYRLGKANTGLDSRGVIVGRVTLSEQRYPDLPGRNRFLNAVLDQLRATPGITSAGVTHNPFVLNQNFFTILRVEGQVSPDGTDPAVDLRRVTPGYFETVGVRPLRGRLFTTADRDSTLPVVIVSQSFVRRYFPSGDPLGHRVRRTGGPHPWATIVGVVPDVMDAGVGVDVGPAIYLPFAQNSSWWVIFVVKASIPVADVDQAIRRAVKASDPNQPVDNVTPLDRLLSNSLGEQRLKALILAALASLALILACTGIYGVTAFLMTERTKEIAIRMALGAEPRTMLARLVLENERWVAGGAGVGLGAAWGAGVVWQAKVPDLTAAGAVAYGLTAVVLLGVSVVAMWAPAYRASRTAPALALRGD